jgi:hypothetical protein
LNVSLGVAAHALAGNLTFEVMAAGSKHTPPSYILVPLALVAIAGMVTDDFSGVFTP